MTLELNPTIDAIEFPIPASIDINPNSPRVLIGSTFLEITLFKEELIINYFWNGWYSSIKAPLTRSIEIMYQLVWDFSEKKIDLYQNNIPIKSGDIYYSQKPTN